MLTRAEVTHVLSWLTPFALLLLAAVAYHLIGEVVFSHLPFASPPLWLVNANEGRLPAFLCGSECCWRSSGGHRPGADSRNRRAVDVQSWGCSCCSAAGNLGSWRSPGISATDDSLNGVGFGDHIAFFCDAFLDSVRSADFPSPRDLLGSGRCHNRRYGLSWNCRSVVPKADSRVCLQWVRSGHCLRPSYCIDLNLWRV
jgi:hypothetical protein